MTTDVLPLHAVVTGTRLYRLAFAVGNVLLRKIQRDCTALCELRQTSNEQWRVQSDVTELTRFSF